MVKKRWSPRKGQVFRSRDALEERLLLAGWEFEGHETGLLGSRVTEYNVGVTSGKTWLMVDMIPFEGKVKVTRIRKLKA